MSVLSVTSISPQKSAAHEPVPRVRKETLGEFIARNVAWWALRWGHRAYFRARGFPSLAIVLLPVEEEAAMTSRVRPQSKASRRQPFIVLFPGCIAQKAEVD